MLKVLLSLIVFLHGAVHIWYVLLISNLVKYRPEMGWTGRSWLFPHIPAEGFYRLTGIALYSLSALLFMISASGILINRSWYPLLTLVSAILSFAVILFFFDGSFQMMVQKGSIGLIINILIIFILITKFYS